MENKKPSIFEIYGQVHGEKLQTPSNPKKNPYSPISVGKRYEPKIVNGKFSLHESINSSSGDRPLATEVKRHFLEIISTYKAFQEQMQRQSDIVDVAETLGGIVEAAKTLTLSEAGDWFDKVTIKRNMSELEKLDKAFDKVAVEARSLDERLHALYEDMGNILNRYYEISDIDPNTMKTRLGLTEKKVPSKGSADYHQHKIAVDTVRNPMKSFMGGPSSAEAEETLMKKFGYSKKEVDKLKESVNEANVGDKMKHRFTKGISIELISMTNRGWKVKQYGDGTPRGKNKVKTAYFDSQDITGDRSLFVKESVVTEANPNDLKMLDWLGDKLARMEEKGKENTPEYRKLEKKYKALEKKVGM